MVAFSSDFSNDTAMKTKNFKIFSGVFLDVHLDKTVIIMKEHFTNGWIILNSFLGLHITLDLWIDENSWTSEVQILNYYLLIQSR